jgi:hypothetical protein
VLSRPGVAQAKHDRVPLFTLMTLGSVVALLVLAALKPSKKKDKEATD